MYLSWDTQTITDFSDLNIADHYDRGFLFTREGRGAMYETRSVRVDLSQFELSSENRRVIRKTENIKMEVVTTPYADYDWPIGKMGKDFYATKFGAGIFSANKIKELLTDAKKSNFNLLLKFSDENKAVGYAICFANDDLLHYSYPFYDLDSAIPNLGIGMMTRAIAWAKQTNKKFAYLGSTKDEAALYKFQFTGAQWWDGRSWTDDIEKLKNELR